MKMFNQLLTMALVMGCSATAPVFARTPPPQIAAQLTALMSEHRVSQANVPGEALTVVTSQWRWSGAVGTSDGTTKPLAPDALFRIASVTKPYTAAAILRLMEMGRLDIEAPISRYIGEPSKAALVAGGYDPDKITVQQLLAHTSGIYDYAQDETYIGRATADLSHQWTRSEQVTLAMTAGKPIDQPGKTYGYSDTGYVLLGEILERQTGKSLAQAVRALVRFDRLGLRRTYWEQLEPNPSRQPISTHFMGPVDVTGANPSLDLFGGGGIVSSTDELAIFYRALVRGEVFDNRATLAVLMTSLNVKRPEGDMGNHNNGVTLVEVGRWKCWGHGGFWGQLVAYCPENDLTFAWTVNQAQTSPESKTKFLNGLAQAIAP
jgi:D-alanyl-D-alanine carboxypeptidase